jgi:hypothetical protein
MAIINDPGDPTSSAPSPNATYWSDEELQAARAYFQQYITDHHLESYGTVDDALNAYQRLRRDNGTPHDTALGGALDMLGWSHAAGPTPTPGPPTPPPPPGPSDPNHLGPLLQPFDQKFTPAPSPAPFQFPDFVLPSGQDVLNEDPGYPFRVNQGLQSLTNSAAAKHMLRTGATLKNFLNFGQQLGSQEYGNAVDRRYQVWNANRGNQLGSYNAAVDKSKLDWQHGFDTWNQDFNIFKWNKTFPYTVLHDQQLLGADAAARA